MAAWRRPLARDDGSGLGGVSPGSCVLSVEQPSRRGLIVAHPQRGCGRVAEQYRSEGARVFFAGRVVCGASRNGHGGEASRLGS